MTDTSGFLGGGYSKFASMEDRKGFVKKVYGILGFQLLLTAGITLIPVMNIEAKIWINTHDGLTIAAAVGLLCISCIMMCCIPLTRMVPVNYGLLFLFTLCESYLMAGIAAKTQPQIVLQALSMTALLVISLTLFAWCTPFDFVLWGPVLILCIFMSMMLSLIFFFVFSHRQMHAFYIGLGILIYSIYLVIDTQLIMGGKRYEVEIDDYVLGALILYTDIIMIFLYILQALTNKR